MWSPVDQGYSYQAEGLTAESEYMKTKVLPENFGNSRHDISIEFLGQTLISKERDGSDISPPCRTLPSPTISWGEVGQWLDGAKSRTPYQTARLARHSVLKLL